MLKISKKEVQIGIMLLIIGGIICFIIKIKIALLPFVFGIFLAYLFNPLINFLRKKNFSYSGAIYVLIILFLFFIAICGFVIFPIFLDELKGLTDMIPKYIISVENFINHLSQEYHHIHLPLIIKELVDQALNKLEEPIISFMENLTKTIFDSLSIIFSLIIAPIISYYILKDMNKIKRVILKIFPKKDRRFILQLGKEISRIFVGYLRGQIWVSIIVGIFTSIGLLIFKIRFYLILGIFSGITNMIPYIGPIIGAIPAVFISLLASPLRALAVIILFILIQQIESTIIGPKIMSEEVGLHPLTIIFALLVGGELMGIWGLIFAVPLAGSIKVIVNFVLRQHNP